MVFNRYLPHISGKIMSEMRVLSIFSITNLTVNKKKQIIMKNTKLSFIPLNSMHGESVGLGSTYSVAGFVV